MKRKFLKKIDYGDFRKRRKEVVDQNKTMGVKIVC
jgi:hypothetical protein